MNLYISRRVSGFTAALMILPLFSFGAAAQLAVSANDGKAVLVNGVNTVPPNPVDDTVTIHCNTAKVAKDAIVKIGWNRKPN